MIVKELTRTIRKGSIQRLDIRTTESGVNIPNLAILEKIGIDEHNDVVYNDEVPEVHMMQEDW